MQVVEYKLNSIVIDGAEIQDSVWGSCVGLDYGRCWETAHGITTEKGPLFDILIEMFQEQGQLPPGATRLHLWNKLRYDIVITYLRGVSPCYSYLCAANPQLLDYKSILKCHHWCSLL